MGAPPGFSDGTKWSVPLIAPLESDLLLVPVHINNTGPYLFMVDPDSEFTSVENSIRGSLDLYSFRDRLQRPNEEDHLSRFTMAEIKTLRVGSLEIANMKVRVHDDETFWVAGRRVRGILGRNVLADSLEFQFDRDRGVMHMATQGQLSISPDATPLPYSKSYGQNKRFLSEVLVNGRSVQMHLDLGARTSMLWPRLLAQFQLPAIAVQAQLVDEYGTRRTVHRGAVAKTVQAGSAHRNAVLILPYGDKRVDEDDFDGQIGQNFFSHFNVTVNWHQKKFWLQPRAGLARFAAERIARWGPGIAGCTRPACVNIVRGQSDGSLRLTRESPAIATAYDVLIGAVDAAGKSLPLPTFLVSFEVGTKEWNTGALPAEFLAATDFVVLDMDPVGLRGCTAGQCVFQRPAFL